MPFMRVFIIAALTADGFIGRDAGHTADWTSREDKQHFVRLTKEAGIMVMGASTFKTIGRALPGRRTIVYTRRPEALAGIGGIEATNEAPRDLVKRLEAEGAEALAVCGGAQIYSLFMESGVVTDLHITIEPILFGKGVPLFSASLEQKLQLVSHDKLNDNVVALHYTAR